VIRRTIVALILLALPVSIYSQQQAAQFSIQGTILAATTNQPIAGAQVSLSKDTSAGTLAPQFAPVLSDERGRFVFNDLDEGTYRLGAIKNGYVRGYPEDVTILRPDRPTAERTIRLTAAATLSGHVRDASGKPVADVPVELVRRVYNQNGRSAQTAARTSTNDLGEYRLYWITPGAYYLAAGSKDASNSRGYEAWYLDRDLLDRHNSVPADYSYSYFSGVTDIDKAAMLDLQPGSQLNDVDFTVTAIGLYRVRGHVIDSRTNQPPAGLNFSWYGGGNPSYDPKTGVFEFTDCPPGDLGFDLEHDSLRAYGTIVIANSDVDGIEMRLEPAAVVTGRILVEGTFPGGNLQRLRVQLSRAARNRNGVTYGVSGAEVAADGTFTLNDLLPTEDYRITVFGIPSGFYLKEARLGGSDAVWNYARAGRSTDIRIVISSRTARVHGVVTDDAQKSKSGIEVALIPEARDRRELFKSAFTDKDGEFNFSGVVPGDYKLFAFDGLQRAAYFDPAVLAYFEERGKPVHLAESSEESIDLNAIPAGSAP
jgi:5-hydroxyisourate hydrolase-like protein (transthyretin family)